MCSGGHRNDIKAGVERTNVGQSLSEEDRRSTEEDKRSVSTCSLQLSSIRRQVERHSGRHVWGRSEVVNSCRDRLGTPAAVVGRQQCRGRSAAVGARRNSQGSPAAVGVTAGTARDRQQPSESVGSAISFKSSSRREGSRVTLPVLHQLLQWTATFLELSHFVYDI